MKAKLLFPLALVVLAVVLAPLAGATRQGGIPPYSVVFSHNDTQLRVLTLTANASVDVVWKDGTCYAGYAGPPIVATWSGPTATGGVTDPTSAPNTAPCAGQRFPDDLEYNLATLDAWWTYGGKPKTNTSTARTIPNPESSENANLFLYKRTVRYILRSKAGASTWTKVAVPAGTNTVHFYGASGG